MNHGTAAAVGATLLAALAPTAAASAADSHGEQPDSRPCVSMREYLAIDLQPAITLRQLERSWEIQGQRQRVEAAAGHYRPWYVYKVCGYSLDEVSMEVGTTLIRPGESSPGREVVKVLYRHVQDSAAVCSAVIC